MAVKSLPRCENQQILQNCELEAKGFLALRMEAKTNPGLLQADSHTQKKKAAKEYGRQARELKCKGKLETENEVQLQENNRMTLLTGFNHIKTQW